MNALSRIHLSLRDDGVLLDLHPQPENSRLEIWQDGRISPLGEIGQHQENQEIEQAEACLATFEHRGLFHTEDRQFFDLLEHHPTVESWLDRWVDEGYNFVAREDLLNSARTLLSAGGGELVVREPVKATLLRSRSRTDQD